MTLVLHAMSSAGSMSLLDPGWWLGSLGAIGIFAVLFAETGLFVGFFLPGDSLLFTAGALCAATPARLSAPFTLPTAASSARYSAPRCGPAPSACQPSHAPAGEKRSEERRVGKECLE